MMWGYILAWVAFEYSVVIPVVAAVLSTAVVCGKQSQGHKRRKNRISTVDMPLKALSGNLMISSPFQLTGLRCLHRP